MGTLVVNLVNRPADSVVEVGNGLGWFVNGRVYKDIPQVEGTVVVGSSDGRTKLPSVDGVEKKDRLVKQQLDKAAELAPVPVESAEDSSPDGVKTQEEKA